VSGPPPSLIWQYDADPTHFGDRLDSLYKEFEKNVFHAARSGDGAKKNKLLIDMNDFEGFGEDIKNLIKSDDPLSILTPYFNVPATVPLIEAHSVYVLRRGSWAAFFVIIVKEKRCYAITATYQPPSADNEREDVKGVVTAVREQLKRFLGSG
jgi:hypothetical protein